MTDLKEQLLKVQMKGYRKNLSLINESLSPSRTVDRYAGTYKRHLKKYDKISNKSELFRRIISSDLVYHGDYHTLRQSQKSVLRILKEIQPKRKIILCLEMFHSTDQKWVDEYLEGKLKEKEFLKKIEYVKKWAYKWANWKPIIHFCRHNHIPILGINSEQNANGHSLKLRDVHSSKVIGKACLQNPDSLVYVVDGDYHICPDHLPFEVNKRLDMFDVKVKTTLIYQNVDHLYWQLARVGKEDSDVLQINENSFCIMNTVPTNKLQSYLNWLEHADDAYYPVNPNWEHATDGVQPNSIPHLVRTICKLLELEIPETALNHLTVFYSSNLRWMNVIEKNSHLLSWMPLIKKKISHNEGFLLEYVDNGTHRYLIYLANSSLNMASEEATHFINVAYRGPLEIHLPPFDFFYRNVLTEALGFFGSKLINEKRRCQKLTALRQYLGQFKTKTPHINQEPYIKIARFLLQHHHLEKRTKNRNDFESRFKPIFKGGKHLSQMASTQLGYQLGQKLFTSVKTGKTTLKTIQSLFKNPLIDSGEAFRIYQKLSK